MAYTKIPKPTGLAYTNLNPLGRNRYDDTLITYDSPSLDYDSGEVLWTGMLKPLGSLTWGQAIIPWSQATFIWSDPTPYTKISKPT